jgi:hypothetical protein
LTVESLLTKVSVMPFAIAALFVGWEYIIPMYFALYIWTSGVKTFYYPTPRVIERSLGKSMRIAYTFIYLPTIGLSIWKPDFMSTTWAAAHTMFPIVTYGFNQMIARRSSAINRRKPGVFDNEHIGPIKEVLFLNMVVSIGAQFKSRGNFYQYYGRALMGYPLGRDEARIASTDWATILFMFFSLWDLSRVNIAAEGVVEDMAWILASVFMVTPNFILMNSWNAREEQWERARKITGAESKKGVDVGYDSSC